MQIELGKIVGVWGVKGWLKLHSYTRNRADISDYSRWRLQPVGRYTDSPESLDLSQAIEVLECRQQGRGIVARLEGVNTRNQAEALIGSKILVDEADLPELEEGEFYWQQLIGLQVVSTQGDDLGRISSMLETGANDVIVIGGQSGNPDVLIPYVKQVVVDVDLAAGTMTVDWDPAYLSD